MGHWYYVPHLPNRVRLSRTANGTGELQGVAKIYCAISDSFIDCKCNLPCNWTKVLTGRMEKVL